MTYLNNAATSYPKAPVLSVAATQAIQNPPPSDGRGGSNIPDITNNLREELKNILGVDNKDNIALMPNSTYALNTAIYGLNLRRGDFIISTMAEHNAVLRPLYDLSDKGINVILAETDDTGKVKLNIWENLIKEYRPKLCIATHASNVTGAVNDIDEMCEITRKYASLTLIDASQSLGIIPFDNNMTNADMIAFTSHKYLLSNPGMGGLYVKDNINLRPLIHGGTGHNSDDEYMPKSMPSHLEAGTKDHVSINCLYSALLWAKENPININKLNYLTDYLTEGLLSAGCRVIIPENVKTPVISFTVDGIDIEDVGYILSNAYDITLRTGLHCAPLIHKCIGTSPQGTIRASLGRFNTKEDCDRLIYAVRDISKKS